MPERSTAPEGNKNRAMHAFERAVECAERGVAERPVVLVAPADVSLLEPVDMRPLLDSVMMGEHPDEGLDALLTSGALEVLCPK